MARYIDADELIRLIELDALCNRPYTKRDVIGCVKTINTADVVSRSEVEALMREIAMLEKALRNSLPSYCQVMAEKKMIEIGKVYGRREVAKEIFEEIEKLFGGTTMMWLRTTPWQWEDYEELKKKYVDGKDEGE